MNGISGIGGMTAGGIPQQTHPVGGTKGAQATPVQHDLAGVEATSSQTVASLSTTSINASSESLVVGNGPVMADDRALGLALLLLTIEYLQSNDEEEKKGLLAMMLALTQGQGGGNGGSFMYNSMSLSIESTQMQFVSTESAISAYSAGTMDPQQASSLAPGAAGLDVSG